MPNALCLLSIRVQQSMAMSEAAVRSCILFVIIIWIYYTFLAINFYPRDHFHSPPLFLCPVIMHVQLKNLPLQPSICSPFPGRPRGATSLANRTSHYNDYKQLHQIRRSMTKEVLVYLSEFLVHLRRVVTVSDFRECLYYYVVFVVSAARVS